MNIQDNLPAGGPISRRRFMHLGGAGLLAGASSLLVVPATGRAQANGLRSIKMLAAAPVTLPFWAVSYVAEDLGFYKEEGLAIDRLGLNNGPSAMTALLAREGLCNLSTPGEMLAAKSRGQATKILMSLTNYTACVLVVSKQFAEQHKIVHGASVAQRLAVIKEVKGARYGITVPGSLTDILIRMTIKAAGNDPDKDARIVPLQSAANLMAAIDNNGIDGFLFPSPFPEQAIAAFGAVPLVRVDEIPEAVRLQGQVMEAREEDVKNHPNVFAAVVRAQLRAMRAIAERPDEIGESLSRTRFSSVKREIWPSMWANNKDSYRSPFVKAENLRPWVAGGLVGTNVDSHTFPYDEVIDMQFVNAGLREIKWKAPA
jgi:NitT/TauT family transport system substrate-binding protein